MDIDLIALKFYDYSSYIRNYSPTTIARYKVGVSFYSRVTGVTNIAQVTPQNVREFFLYGRTQRNWKTNTFICFYNTLTVFFRWCVSEGYLKADPMVDMQVPKLEKRLPPKLSKQESLRLLEIVYNYPYEFPFLRYRNHAIFSMFVFAGLRRKELLTLKYTDVDIDNLTLFIRQGKGSKDRIIPISYTLAQSLKKYVQERKRTYKTCAEFFVSSNYNRGFTDSGLKRLVGQMRQASGLKFTIHKLRHSFATLMLEGGCDIYSLSKMMGHSDIKTTTIYLAASAEHLRMQMTKHPLNN